MLSSGWEARWDREKTEARLLWVQAIQIVYAAGLGLLGISAPERMDRPAEESNDPRANDGGESS